MAAVCGGSVENVMYAMYILDVLHILDTRFNEDPRV